MSMFAPRTLGEIKDDIRSRVGLRAPFSHADKADAEEALARLDSIESEKWAAAWSEIGARWEDKAKAAEARGDAKQAKAAFLKAYGYYGIARHPFPNSPGKRQAYLKTREMYLAASRYFDVPLENRR
jgi:esterase FrsA